MKVSISCIATILLIFTASSPCDGQNISTNSTVQMPVSKSNNRMILWVSVAAALLVIGLLAAVITFLAFYRRRMKSPLKTILPVHRKTETRSSKLSASPHLDAINFGPRRFGYAKLRAATNDFSDANLLGRGGFGCVYKGVILEFTKEEITVAIKRMAKNSKQGEREFHAEVLSVGRLRHRNLASLLGWCHEREELLLVYEFMAKGSLDQHLYQKVGYPTLPWPSRLHILHGIASALEYLHSGWEKCILHRDVKPSNVLLDAHMTARLGDFGLARLAGHTVVSELKSSSGFSMGSNVGGTLGYMAPEVLLYGQLTKKADVYSFGMVALEVVCGRRPPGFHSEDDEDNLVEWVWRMYTKGQLLEVMNPSLCALPGMDSSEVQQQVTSVLHLGMLCTVLDPALRPPSNRLVQALSGDWSVSLPSSRFDSRLPSSGKNHAVYLGARVFSYAEIQAATENFSDNRVVGRGSYGHVYKGVFPDELTVAIKRLVSPNSRGDEFPAEILNLIGRSRHRNLVSLLGWCYEQGELLLVYEFMENGCLDGHLHPTDHGTAATLPWTSRFEILQGVAAALDYLHSGLQENCILHREICILHRDIKPSNVLLDKHMTAKVADFGLNRLAGAQEMGEPVDSPYVAPEMVEEGSSVKSDVYSFGMLALEVVCGRRPHVAVRGEESLVKWVWSMHERGQLLDVVDASLRSADEEAFPREGDFDFDAVKQRQQITRVIQLGMLCTLPDPSLRPHSKRLLQALYGDWNVSLPTSYGLPAMSVLPSSTNSFGDYSSTDSLLRYTDKL